PLPQQPGVQQRPTMQPRTPQPGTQGPPTQRPTTQRPTTQRPPTQRPSAASPTRTTALAPPVPLLPASTAQPLTRDQSRMAIGILVGVLVFALALAVWGLSRVPPLPGLTSSDGETFATAAESAGATDTPEGTEPGTSAPETPAGS